MDAEFIQVDTVTVANFNCTMKNRQTQIDCQGW